MRAKFDSLMGCIREEEEAHDILDGTAPDANCRITPSGQFQVLNIESGEFHPLFARGKGEERRLVLGAGVPATQGE